MRLRQQGRLSIFTALSSGRKTCHIRAREPSLGAISLYKGETVDSAVKIP